ncbi:MAG: ABC transporter ATP-binding protein [Clostridiales bacterium]|nr:ABC transporter ATP-binding protein [Clostridiales bacterium]
MENFDTIIEVNDITMRFNLAEEKTDTIKEYFVKLISGKLHFNEFFALKNVSFQIKRGEAVALIGKNGSGKSTMLKILAGVMYPTKGSVTVNGSIAPLIELGAGFDMELTAKENIYLNGAILGHDRKFMDQHFDEIVDFSELREFINAPLKNFSSGMTARLGFAIATIIKADILIVDEVLSVGDFRFREKCQAKIAQLLEGGTTLLFVSHSKEQVQALCPRAVWLDHGHMMAFGDTEEVYDLYEKQCGF